MGTEAGKCPQCGSASNGSRNESYLVCRECGMAYTEYGTDRRRELTRQRVRRLLQIQFWEPER